MAESAGGSLGSYYWMFGQYDGVAVFSLIESSDLTAIAERAEAITYQPPGT